MELGPERRPGEAIRVHRAPQRLLTTTTRSVRKDVAQRRRARHSLHAGSYLNGMHGRDTAIGPVTAAVRTTRSPRDDQSRWFTTDLDRLGWARRRRDRPRAPRRRPEDAKRRTRPSGRASVEGTDIEPPGLQQYLLVHGTARVTDGGGPQLLQELADVYLGPDVKFPAFDNPPPGRIMHISVERIAGVGPWARGD